MKKPIIINVITLKEWEEIIENIEIEEVIVKDKILKEFDFDST